MHEISIRPDTDDEAQLALLGSPVGALGSGYARYSAAMYFYQLGQISAELLEVYRKCCKFDDEDPTAMAVHEQLRN